MKITSTEISLAINYLKIMISVEMNNRVDESVSKVMVEIDKHFF